MSKVEPVHDEIADDEDDGLSFSMGPSVVQPTPAKVAPAPPVVHLAPAEPIAAPEGPIEVTPVVSPGPTEDPPRKEPMKVPKIRVPVSMHAQVIVLMESFGCVNESQIYRQVIHIGLKHSKRSR